MEEYLSSPAIILRRTVLESSSASTSSSPSFVYRLGIVERTDAVSFPRLNETSDSWSLSSCILRLFFGGGVVGFRASGLVEVDGIFLGSKRSVCRCHTHKGCDRTFFKASQLEEGADADLEVAGGDMVGAKGGSAGSITVQEYVSVKMYSNGAKVRRRVTQLLGDLMRGVSDVSHSIDRGKIDNCHPGELCSRAALPR